MRGGGILVEQSACCFWQGRAWLVFFVEVSKAPGCRDRSVCTATELCGSLIYRVITQVFFWLSHCPRHGGWMRHVPSPLVAYNPGAGDAPEPRWRLSRRWQWCCCRSWPCVGGPRPDRPNHRMAGAGWLTSRGSFPREVG